MTQSQLAANRANAQLSTGPRTEEGKKRSSLNAFRHGLTGQIVIHTPEDQDAFQKHCDAIREELAPPAPSKPTSPRPSPRTTGASIAPAPSKIRSSPRPSGAFRSRCRQPDRTCDLGGKGGEKPTSSEPLALIHGGLTAIGEMEG